MWTIKDRGSLRINTISRLQFCRCPEKHRGLTRVPDYSEWGIDGLPMVLSKPSWWEIADLCGVEP
jgi:hypothetical protein